MTENGYNGWKNYETWNVALWIDNDQGSYSQRQEMAQEAWDNAASGDAYKGQTREDSAKYSLSKALQEWIEEMNPLASEASMFSDLLNAALSEVDWYEIAENFLEDVEKEPEEGECKHCGATGPVGEECENCEPSDELGPMVYQTLQA